MGSGRGLFIHYIDVQKVKTEDEGPFFYYYINSLQKELVHTKTLTLLYILNALFFSQAERRFFYSNFHHLVLN